MIGPAVVTPEELARSAAIGDRTCAVLVRSPKRSALDALRLGGRS